MERKYGVPHSPKCFPVKCTYASGPNLPIFFKKSYPHAAVHRNLSFLPFILGTKIPFEDSLLSDLWEHWGSPRPGLSSPGGTCAVDGLLVTKRWTAAAFSQSV